MTSSFSASDLSRAVTASLESLTRRRGSIDAANVYPVPDADTGTNLVMTFDAVAAALAKAGDEAHEIARAVSTGALMGARGNSGVIMAQILRGLAESVEAGPADIPAIKRAFKRAADLAYEAVLEPAEGTILTVARAAADAAQGAHATVPALFAAAASAARDALAHTPDQMPLLARAGVVDAGGMGLVAVLTACARSLGAPVDDDPEDLPAAGIPPAIACALEEGPSAYSTEIQYLLDAPDEAIPALRGLLGTIGDSVVVVGGGGTFRVHAHTDDPDRATAFGAAIGTVSAREVVRFADQIADNVAAVTDPIRGARGIPASIASAPATLFAVVAGQGATRLFSELGARIIPADDRMLVSFQALEAAVATAEGYCIVLPNNEEVFARAQPLMEQYPDSLAVFRTTDLAHGLALAVAYGDRRPATESVDEMGEVYRRVRTGQVVVSPVAGQTVAGPVMAGQAIGFVEGTVVHIANDPLEVLREVAATLPTEEREVVTVLCGADCPPAQRDAVADVVGRASRGLMVETHDAGQPIHRFLLAIE